MSFLEFLLAVALKKDKKKNGRGGKETLCKDLYLYEIVNGVKFYIHTRRGNYKRGFILPFAVTFNSDKFLLQGEEEVNGNFN